MKNTVLILIVIAAIFSTPAANAQYVWVGVDGSSVLPTGDLKVVTKSGGGGGVHLDAAISKSFQARFDTSWLQFSSKEFDSGISSKARVIPVRLGLVWLVGPWDGTRFTIGAMGGAYFRQIKTTITETSASDNDTFFGAGASIGMLIPMGPGGQELEIKASYDMWFDETSTTGEDMDMALVRLGVGYRFNI